MDSAKGDNLVVKNYSIIGYNSINAHYVNLHIWQ
jgi:hypothetical protein